LGVNVYKVEMIRGAASLSRDDLNQGFVYRIHLSGNLVMEISDEFTLFVSTLINGGMRKLVLDMAELKYVDSAGLGTFISLAKLIRGKGGDLALQNVNERVLETLRLVRLHDFIPFFKSERQVADHFFTISR
jgi:anti-anti-sigma factor